MLAAAWISVFRIQVNINSWGHKDKAIIINPFFASLCPVNVLPDMSLDSQYIIFYVFNAGRWILNFQIWSLQRNTVMMVSTSSSNDNCHGENNCVLCKKTFDYSCEKVRVSDKGLENILNNSVKHSSVHEWGWCVTVCVWMCNCARVWLVSAWAHKCGRWVCISVIWDLLNPDTYMQQFICNSHFKLYTYAVFMWLW